MPCVDATDRPLVARLIPALMLLALVSACGSWQPPGAPTWPAAPSAAAPSPVPSASPSTVPSTASSTAEPATGQAAAGPGAGAVARPARRAAPTAAPSVAPSAAPTVTPVVLAPPRTARHWADFQQQAAERLVAASLGATYGGPVPEPLLAIPVLEIELNADGSVRRILVKRQPRQALDTVQLAIAAVHRAAPFGAVSHLPRPWKFTEVFLFDEQRRFKPRTLDL